MPEGHPIHRLPRDHSKLVAGKWRAYDALQDDFRRATAVRLPFPRADNS